MTEPTTTAGRALLARLPDDAMGEDQKAIDAIEREARDEGVILGRQQERERIGQEFARRLRLRKPAFPHPEASMALYYTDVEDVCSIDLSDLHGDAILAEPSE